MEDLCFGTVGIGRKGRRSKQLLNDIKGKKKYRNLKEEVQDHSLWRIFFGSDYGFVAIQTAY
jgi:hypothetical protein